MTNKSKGYMMTHTNSIMPSVNMLPQYGNFCADSHTKARKGFSMPRLEILYAWGCKEAIEVRIEPIESVTYRKTN